PRGRPVAGALCACVQGDDGPGAPSIPAVAAARTRAAAARAVRCRPFGRSPAYGVRRPGSLHPLLQAGLPHHPGRPGASVAVLTTLESTATERPSLAGDRVGEVLAGRYRVLRRLGAGGMGTVYLAEHVHLGRLTAVKVLCPPLCADDPGAEQRFRQEGLLVAKVRHPSVAQVYDFDRLPDGQFLLAMEYVEGETVAQRLERGGPFPLPQAIRVLQVVADALNHVHWIGILHRDLKPQNVMLGPGGDVKLLDFGVAHEMAQLLAADGFQPSTLAYMSPDQLLGDALGPASDIYALGAVFHEMLTGRLPHARATVPELRIQRLL